MTITHVQAKTDYLGGTANTTLTLDAAPTQGNLLVAIARWNGNFISSVNATANSGAGWTEIDAVLLDGITQGSWMAWKIAGASESATQTPFNSSSANRTVIVSEYSTTNGWDAAPVEASTSNVDADATKTTTGTCDPTDGVERLIVGCGSSDGNRTFSAEKVNGSTTGVVERGDIGGGTSAAGETICLFDLITASTSSGNYTSESVCSVADDGGALMAIFKPALPAATAPFPPWMPWRWRSAISKM